MSDLEAVETAADVHRSYCGGDEKTLSAGKTARLSGNRPEDMQFIVNLSNPSHLPTANPVLGDRQGFIAAIIKKRCEVVIVEGMSPLPHIFTE